MSKTYWHLRMIQKILSEGSYKFEGDLTDLKKCMSSFKITEVICMGEIQELNLCEVFGRFRYHGQNHRVRISKYWGDKQILFIEYKGVEG